MTNQANKYPKKYWWAVVVALPVILALIAILPSLLKKSKPTGGSEFSSTVTGSGNVVTIDNSNRMTVINNVSVIAKEYEKYTGQPLRDDELKRQIESAVAAVVKDNHSESIRLLEELAKKVPLPAIYNNLGVEYAKVKNTEASEKAFSQAIAKDPTYREAKENLKLLASGAPARSAGTTMEASSVPAIAIENLTSNPAALSEIHVVASGSASSSFYSIKYQPKPGTTVLVEPGKYDVLVKTGGGGLFVLAKDIDVKERTIAKINPNEILGSLTVDPLTRKGFSEIKELFVVEPGSGDSRPIRQWTDKLGVSMPIAPGTYDVLCKTADGSEFDLVKNVPVKARETKRVITDNEVAAFVVYEPKIPGLNVKAIYALRAGTNEIAGKSDRFGTPMMVYAGESYDVALEQEAGLTRLRSNVTPSRGAVTEVR